MSKPTLADNPEEIEQHLLRVAVRYLSYRPRFTAEVRLKLFQEFRRLNLDSNPLLVDKVINRLVDERFLNDQLLASDYALSQFKHRVKGPLYISAKLQKMGLEVSLINQIMAQQLPYRQQQLAVRLLLKRRFGSKPANIQEVAKASRFLLSRGFEGELVRRVIDEWTQKA